MDKQKYLYNRKNREKTEFCFYEKTLKRLMLR